MSKWITTRAENMPLLSQPTQMECWITCYQMILNASHINWDKAKIQRKLEENGCSNAAALRSSGIDDGDLIKLATALGMGHTKTADLLSLRSIKIQLQMCGPLWVAGQFKMDEDGQKKHYKHVVVIIGVDEDRNEVCYVNPWTWSFGDTVSKQWIDFGWMKNSLQKTSAIEAGCQYLTPLKARLMALSQN